MGIIQATKLVFEYLKYGEDGEAKERNRAIDEVSLDVEEGQFIAVLGHNGSGKSTLAKHINALLLPTKGTLYIDSMNPAKENELWKIRQKAGMVFQNPDNQIIGNIVEEDVAFGPENLGIETKDIWERVNESLEAVGMTAYRKKSPNRLSGGQKQRVAIAGVVAMRPKCIVLDEPTAMLDPNGRKEVLRTIRELNQKENVTVILITHYMEEVVFADNVYVMDNGHLVMQGTPREIFSQVDKLKEFRLDVPQVTLLAHELKQSGVEIPEGILTIEELVDGLCRVKADIRISDSLPNGIQVSPKGTPLSRLVHTPPAASLPFRRESELPPKQSGLSPRLRGEGLDRVVKLENVTYTYSPGTAYEMHALKTINLEIPQGQFVGVIGHTGSGKSTLIQHFNGLIKPTSGMVFFEGQDIWEEGYPLKQLRSQVGLVFQYPEHQLFETDVLKDVCFGPKNQGLSEEECKERAIEALEHVGLAEKYFDKSPFELSGGQRRRAAIAGVLAMNPKVLVLDEPTAGLDPKGRDDILEQISFLHQQRNITIILVSHSMEDIAKYVERIIVMNGGEKCYDDTPKEVFSHYKELEKMGLAAPQITYIMHALKEQGMQVDVGAITVEEAKASILQAIAGGKDLEFSSGVVKTDVTAATQKSFGEGTT